MLWITGIPLNPMSAALGALTIAIATEFSVILVGPLPRGARRRALGSSEALRRAYARTGAAVLASGVTAIAGFAVLIASDIQMLRDFGFVTVIDLAVALLGVMVALPAALRLAGGAMRDRYSIVVGLLFLAVIVVAVVNTIEGRRRRDARARQARRRAGRCPSSPCPRPRAGSKATPTSPRTTAKPRRLPCPEDARRTPPAGSAPPARSASATSSTGRW